MTCGKSPKNRPGDGQSAACLGVALRCCQRTSLAIARKQGYQLAFTLEDGLADVRHLDNIPRLLISGNPSLKAFASSIAQIQETDPVRVMHVDLDYVYDPDPAQQTKNINTLIQRSTT
ncbi:biofilm PGA synthesis lipoprotein PgaB [Enterobacter cloacae]|uniref:Biofilm PGA synthesis lipoprotein PgaB n=1 Tax=Enterobacter cloacae TaxID=550 RepID=A0A377LSZ0_ENTCL|nr:biofilm PGA synthesis lipoprotein PgaB [Enterobacter cloacae]